MIKETCVPIQDYDVVAFIAELQKVAENFRENGVFSGKSEKIWQNGFDIVSSKYSYGNFRKPFVNFWNKVGKFLCHIEGGQRKK